jgi:DNA polymerase
MILIDMPEASDTASGQLLSGDPGALFDRMLGAIGRDRTTIYLASLCPARPPGGILGDAMLAPLARIARHHIALVAPKRLWLMGQAVSRALAGPDASPSAGRLLQINHDGGNVTGVASFSPRFLLQRPKMKAAAWADMQALIEGM